MKKVEKLKVFNKTINNKKCKISKYSNGSYDITIKGNEKERDINIVYFNNMIRLDQTTDKKNNEFYAVELIENQGKEFFAYSNDKNVGDLKQLDELANEIKIVQEDVKLLKNIKMEINELEIIEDLKYQMIQY